MKIIIRSLKLQNFKATRDLTVNFGDRQTNISGRNATGKTTIFDAFTWLMFGKNSEDEKEFNIKTLDKNNNAIHRLKHEVSGLIECDGIENHLRKEFREKWIKRKGSEESEFSGHETSYFVNDVPVTQAQYKTKIDEIINENLFKLISNPNYFNSMKWTERRDVLTKMAGNISDIDVAGDNADLLALVTLLKNKTIKELRAQIASEKKRIKDELEKIPTRIEEAELSKPQIEDYNYINKQIKEIEGKISDVEKSMDDKSSAYKKQNDEIAEKHQELNNLKSNLRDSQFADKSAKNEALQAIEQKINTSKSNRQTFIRSRDLALNSIKSNETQIHVFDKEVQSKRSEFEIENAKEIVFDANKFICPSCKRPMEADDIETMKTQLTENFNNDKLKRLDVIRQRGKFLNSEIEKLQSNNADLSEDVKTNEGKITELDKELETLESEKQNTVSMEDVISDKTKELQSKVDAFVIPEIAPIDNLELRSQRSVMMTDIDKLKIRLQSKEQIQKTDARIKDLSEQEKKLAQELAELEKREFNIDAFNKKKIETIEQRINSKFQLVKFKMFALQINGGEDECCECLLNGVPYSDVNTAGKINAGLDIINALSDHYGVSAPIFIDNRESIIDVIPTNSQTVNLIVTNDNELTFSTN